MRTCSIERWETYVDTLTAREPLDVYFTWVFNRPKKIFTIPLKNCFAIFYNMCFFNSCKARSQTYRHISSSTLARISNKTWLLWSLGSQYNVRSCPLGSRLWGLIVTLSLSHWYPGSGVVLDCIISWSLHSFLLCYDPHQQIHQT